MKTKQRAALNNTEIGLENDALPEWVELIPSGQVVGRDGRSWSNSNPQGIIDAFNSLGMDLPVDIEHATELKAPRGEAAPAAGWIKALENRTGSIWGRVEWNPTGRELVGGKQYRYLSPVILYQKDSGLIAGLTSVALTNRPNLNLQALNHQTGSAEPPKEKGMLKALLAALALPEDATADQALAKITALKTDLASATNQMQNPSLNKFVPRADYDAVLLRATNAEQAVQAVQQKQLDGEIETAINAALAAGKITPATKEYHKAQCAQEGGLQRFADFCAAAPVIGDPSGLDKKTPDGDQQTALNAEQTKIAGMFGNTAEDIAKYGK
jgi:phage I-like protein